MSTTTNKDTKRTAAQAYAENLAEANRQMEALRAHIAKLSAQESPNWGHVGEVATIARTLREAAEWAVGE